jgi:MFS family permease
MSESKPREMTCSSRVDLWLAIVLLGTIVGPVVVGIQQLLAGEQEGWILLKVGVFIIILLLGIGFPCRYTLTDRELVIRGGVTGALEYRIELRKITDVRPSYNPLSAPALSLKRIKIRYEGATGGFMLISPKDRQGFIDELNRRRALLATQDRE